MLISLMEHSDALLAVVFEQTKYSSILQVEEHPSVLSVLLSSHYSSATITPSPQSGSQVLSPFNTYKSLHERHMISNPLGPHVSQLATVEQL